MIEIHLTIWGDVWVNKEEVIQKIYTISPSEPVLFHTLYEGISLKASGILQVIDDWAAATNRDINSISIHTPNQYEKINYKFANKIQRSGHFFRSKIIKYYQEYTLVNKQAKLFGLFLGRYTPVRNMLALDVNSNYRDQFLISIMSADRLGADQWWDPQIENIGSLDNADVSDQYKADFNTNQSLLKFYNDFQIEVVIETITVGESFFPTEKTVRPIMGSKPFIVYAPINFLNNLRKIGFKTFDTIWSEEYDQYEGIERWNRMRLTIGNIIEQGYDCDIAQDIVQYNYNHLQKLIKNG